VGNHKDEILCDVVPMEACLSYWKEHDNLIRKLCIMVLPTRLLSLIGKKKFLLYPLTPSQLIKDKVQMKQKRENENKNRKTRRKDKKNLRKKLRRGRKVFLPTRSFRKKKSLKIKLKRYFYMNNLQASFFVKEHLHALPHFLMFVSYLLK